VTSSDPLTILGVSWVSRVVAATHRVYRGIGETINAETRGEAAEGRDGVGQGAAAGGSEGMSKRGKYDDK
jgi:hypothetical protein